MTETSEREGENGDRILSRPLYGQQPPLRTTRQPAAAIKMEGGDEPHGARVGSSQIPDACACATHLSSLGWVDSVRWTPGLALHRDCGGPLLSRIGQMQMDGNGRTPHRTVDGRNGSLSSAGSHTGSHWLTSMGGCIGCLGVWRRSCRAA